MHVPEKTENNLMIPQECQVCALAVEDDPDFVFILKAIADLIPGRPICIEAVDRVAAVEARLVKPDTTTCPSGTIQTTRVDIILTDLGLPDSSGAQTFSRVREIANGLPVIVMTALRESKIVNDVMALGAEDFLEKNNLSPERLERAIRNTLERHQLKTELKNQREYSRKLEEKLTETSSLLHRQR